jgi:putative PIN family toxin of toxin-antitoxin system
MIITLDTNVLYQALRNRAGASHFVLNLIAEREIRLAISVPVYSEYKDVLLRKKSLSDLGLNEKDIQSVLEFIAYAGIPFTIFYTFRPNLRDEADNIFVELSIASCSKYLITSNVKDFTKGNDLSFNDLNIITPSAFVRLWRKEYEK